LAPTEQVNLSTGTITYLVTDSLASVRGTVSSSGSLAGTTNYDAWGNPETTGGLTATTPFGFAGGYTDPTGLIYLVNRYYDPQTGQFGSLDPDLMATHLPYAYASSNPVSAVDPLGLYAVLYKAWCNTEGCINITKRCGSDNKCMMYWALGFYRWSASYTAYDVDLYFEIDINGLRVVNRQHYGHSENGHYIFHGRWGVQKGHDWGYYCITGICSHMGPSDEIGMRVWGSEVLSGGQKAQFSGAGDWTHGRRRPWKKGDEWPDLPI
jgi:RHS repeat-associated protein